MSVSDTYEFSTLDWLCLGNLSFEHDEEMGCDVCLYTVRSVHDERKSAPPFLVLRKDGEYRIGQLSSYEFNEDDDEYTYESLRHPSLIKQEYKLPQNMPAQDSFLGPIIGVNVMRTLRLIQATLSGENDVRDDASYYLHDFYAQPAPQPQKPSFTVLRFA